MEANVSVICFKSKVLKNGESPLMVRICKDGKRKYHSLGISVKPNDWNFTKNTPKSKCPNCDELLIIINNTISKFQKIIIEKKVNNQDFTASTLLEATTEPQKRHPATVGEVFLNYIQSLKDEKRLRYAGMYEVSYSSFIKFNKHMDIPFSDVDVAWLKKYENWMKANGYAVNTIGTRLRHLRAVFNKAVELGYTEAYPFNAFKLSKITQDTAKRALSKSDVQKVIKYKGKTEMESLAVDLFTFSYFEAGINFIDMAMLKHENIVDGQLVYYRKKTKKRIIVPLQSQALAIIAKYRAKSSVYLFPILSLYHQTEVQKANRLHKVLAKVNSHLKDIGEKLALPLPLTTYVARHSFATVLKRAGVATSIISESLGHSSEHITQVYLDSFENEQVNRAMKHLL